MLIDDVRRESLRRGGTSAIVEMLLVGYRYWLLLGGFQPKPLLRRPRDAPCFLRALWVHRMKGRLPRCSYGASDGRKAPGGGGDYFSPRV